jgi:dihydrofolate synthase / folylpolyglutamate synthase
MVFAAMRDKEIEPMLRCLAAHVSALVVTRASNPRSADPSHVAAVAARVTPDLRIEISDAPRDALASAWRYGPAVVVAGSIFLLADVMKALGRS